MKLLVFFALLSFCQFPILLHGQTILCEQEPITVYYVVNKTDDGKDDDGWKIYLDILNRGTVDLFYTKQFTIGTLEDQELLPSYVIINIANATGTHANQPMYVHGSMTVHMTTDKSSVFKVGVKRYEKTFTTRIKKGEEPRLTGSFTTMLVPLDSIKLFKLR